MRFKTLKELLQYEEFYKRKMKRQEDIKKMQGITPEKWEEMRKTNTLISTQEIYNKMILEDIKQQREELINEEVEKRLKEQQPSQEQIEKEVKPQIEKIINDTFKNLK